ncbi:MAG: ABC transporter ATP-binding protein [Pyrinomonadaceae bacterium]|nr:ABC transporter ATP-binding protein [Pyrinomonadaceae bacterium]
MLELKNITKKFGGIVANDDVSIAVKGGTIHAIVGENGAGKSTIMKIAYGLYKPDSGEIFVNGEFANINSPADAIRLKIGMVHQHFMLIETMSVVENIVLGMESGGNFNLDLDAANLKIKRLSDELNLQVNPNAIIENLSVGQQQRIELLKALYADADLLILDEPTAVLSPLEVTEFFGILRRMRESGKTIVIITHKLDEVLAISDFVTVMRDGKVVGKAGNIATKDTNARDLARMIVGREVLLRVEKNAAKVGEIVLSVKNLSVNNFVKNVSFEIKAGEIVGIAGVEGNGQSELVEAIAGLIKISGGEIKFLTVDISNTSARSRKNSGIAHVPEDRHKRALLMDFDLADNSILGVHYKQPISTANGFLSFGSIGRKVSQIISDFDVRPADKALPIRTLSGGNQQKLVIGREFDIKPKLLLVSQPTRGVDIGAIEFIHRKLIELRDAGAAILLVSAELEEVLSLSDRILIIRAGEIVGETKADGANVDEIGLLMTSRSS